MKCKPDLYINFQSMQKQVYYPIESLPVVPSGRIDYKTIYKKHLTAEQKRAFRSCFKYLMMAEDIEMAVRNIGGGALYQDVIQECFLYALEPDHSKTALKEWLARFRRLYLYTDTITNPDEDFLEDILVLQIPQSYETNRKGKCSYKSVGLYLPVSYYKTLKRAGLGLSLRVMIDWIRSGRLNIDFSHKPVAPKEQKIKCSAKLRLDYYYWLKANKLSASRVILAVLELLKGGEL